MPQSLVSPLIQRSIALSTSRKKLIGVLKGVIRQDRKLIRQLERKYKSHQALEEYRESLKARIRELSTPTL